MIVKSFDMSKVFSIIDIGTGAGFPGIPLKIVFPEIQVVLLDSLNKRIRFLDEVIQQLGLEKIETIHGRAEDFAKKTQYREKFDFCVSRAVANLATLSEYCLPYVKIGGYFVPYKSEDIDKEVEQAENSVQILGGTVEEVKKFKLPGTEIGRALIKIQKNKDYGKKVSEKGWSSCKRTIIRKVGMFHVKHSHFLK